MRGWGGRTLAPPGGAPTRSCPPARPAPPAADTKSNQWTGKKTFGGRCLHYIDPNDPGPSSAAAQPPPPGMVVVRNPYVTVIEAIGRSLAPFDDDNLIP